MIGFLKNEQALTSQDPGCNMHRFGVEKDIIWANVGTRQAKQCIHNIDFQVPEKFFEKDFVCLNI
jgi:hypothetical protein